MKLSRLLLILTVLFATFVSAGSRERQTESAYSRKPEDPQAFYFTPENYGFKADGKSDVSQALQKAINQVKTERNFGILFIPEGDYRISRTIYIPGAIRLIGYGARRPRFILSKNSPGFSEPHPSDKGKSKYVFWFTGGIVSDESRIGDAGAGTFYSCMSNVDIRIEEGNPEAVALRTHYAQHSFVSHVRIDIGSAKAGIFDVGNEMEDLEFIGGEYGIMTTKASPGWPVMMVDARFSGQRKAAILSQEGGLSIVGLTVSDVPTVFQIDENSCDRLFLEKARLENVSGPAFVIPVENNSNTSVSFRDVDCSNVPLLVSYPRSGEKTSVPHQHYHIKSFTHGLQMDSMTDSPKYRTDLDVSPLAKAPARLEADLPPLPAMETWVNVQALGAKGDGVTDDTEAIRKAVEQYDNLYFPSGWYVVSETIKMKPETRFIGLHPFATQLCVLPGTPAFSGFGAPVALLESSEGGNNVLNGIGINTGSYNYRAVGVKWMAGEDSYLNDVKFVGGHGTMRKPGDTGSFRRDRGYDPAWDNQYWSLWVTDGGGGTFKDIWSASTYSTNGFYASYTGTPSRIYAMSVEHHVRNEVRFNQVSNWKVYCLQTEEESVESSECQPIEMDRCSDITFANLYMFRVIRVNRPYHSSARIRGCKNLEFIGVHNFGQVMYSNDLAIYDQDKDIEVRPWEIGRLTVTGEELSAYERNGEVGEIATGFEFAQGMAHDRKGNVFFCDTRMPRIWKWSREEGLSLVADFPWKPYGIAFDTQDKMLVCFRYDRQPGFEADPVNVDLLPDARGTSFSGWGNSGYAVLVYAIDPECPESTIKALELVPMGQVGKVAKAIYPSNRWRDFHDFGEAVTYVPEKCFLAPDGKTIIPQQYDLARSASLLEAVPGKPYYTSDDYDRRVVRLDVAADGTLSNLQRFVETGEFGCAWDSDGNVYVADGDIRVFDKKGNPIKTLHIPKRPCSLTIAGDLLYVSARSSVYSVKIK